MKNHKEENFEIEEESEIGEEHKHQSPCQIKWDDEEDKLDLDPNAIDAYWLQRELFLKFLFSFYSFRPIIMKMQFNHKKWKFLKSSKKQQG